MKSRNRVFVLAIAASLTAGLFAQDEKKTDEKPAPKYEETTAGLEKWVNDIFAAIDAKDEAKTLELTGGALLPNAEAWFKDVFGDETGAKAAAEYLGHDKLAEELAKLFKDRAADGRTSPRAHVAEGDEATGLQRDAIKEMKRAVKLYTVRLTKPGEEGSPGFTLWSFVYVDGQFRLVGKMRAALREANQPTTQPAKSP